MSKHATAPDGVLKRCYLGAEGLGLGAKLSNLERLSLDFEGGNKIGDQSAAFQGTGVAKLGYLQHPSLSWPWDFEQLRRT